MCGIFGFIKNKTFSVEYNSAFEVGNDWKYGNSYRNDPEVKLVKNLLFPTALRGVDSTGFALVDHENNKVYSKKLPLNAIQFSGFGEFDEVEKFADYNKIGIIGHCRAGTIGTVSMLTSHPFVTDNLIGVHNGTLHSYNNLTKKKYYSDSHALYLGMDECDVYTNYLETLNGSFALAWYDNSTKKYYLARNKDRPMYYFKDKDFLSFASEKEILDFGMKRTYGNFFTEKDYQAIEEVKDHNLYEIDPTTLDITLYEFKERISTFYTYQGKDKNKCGNSSNYCFPKTPGKAETNSPFRIGDRKTLIPCGTLEYQNSSANYGSVYGYLTEGSSTYYWIAYGIENVKEWLSDYFTAVLTSNVDLSGKISNVSYQHINSRKECVDLVDPMTNAKIHPMRDKDDYDMVMVFSIEAKSLNYYEDAVFN